MHNKKLKKLINRVIAVASLSVMVLAGTAFTVNAAPVWPSNVDTESNAAIVEKYRCPTLSSKYN